MSVHSNQVPIEVAGELTSIVLALPCELAANEHVLRAIIRAAAIGRRLERLDLARAALSEVRLSSSRPS